jgi:membrane peptidoglycan carboxypeptidase
MLDRTLREVFIGAVRRILLAFAAAFTAAAVGLGWLLPDAPVDSLRTSVTRQPGGPKTSREIGLGAADLPVLSELPPHFVLAVLLSEDRRFAFHAGIDYRELLHALRQSLLAGAPLRGASTITQQLARSAFLSNERTLSRKLFEAHYARQLERAFNKDEILSLYLQMLHWGPDVYGLSQATRTYFGKEPTHLTLEESIVLVSLLPDPDARGEAFLEGVWDQTLQRALMRRIFNLHWVLHGLESSGRALPEKGDAVLELPLEAMVAAEMTQTDLEVIVAAVEYSLERIPVPVSGAPALPPDGSDAETSPLSRN